jgi:hypothetical protein
MTQIIKIVDLQAGTDIEREMTADEIAVFQLGTKTSLERKAAAEQTATDKAALLAKMGLTADEAKLLLS